MNITSNLLDIKSLINHYLQNNDTEGFGCACTPTHKCGTCLEAERQKHLLQVIKIIKDTTTGLIKSEADAYDEAAKETIHPIAQGAIGRWWFSKGYKHSNKVKLEGWYEAVIDALVVSCIYNKSHDDNPKKAINDLLSYETLIALDPQVSESAQALIDLGFKRGLAQGIE